jgi:hypothetical protein
MRRSDEVLQGRPWNEALPAQSRHLEAGLVSPTDHRNRSVLDLFLLPTTTTLRV